MISKIVIVTYKSIVRNFSLIMGNSTIVGMTKNGQYLISLPKTIAQAMRLKKGDRIEFLFDEGDVLVRKV